MALRSDQKKQIKEVTTTILDGIFLMLIKWFIIGSIIIGIFNYFNVSYDSTDGETRSGMGMHTDALTGCQYLSTPRGGITPRLNQDGQHICDGG